MAKFENGLLILQSPLGHATMLVDSATAQGLPTPPDINRLRRVVIRPDQTVRFRDDGTAPTSTTGMRLLADEILVYDGNFNDIKIIAASTSANIDVAYYGL